MPWGSNSRITQIGTLITNNDNAFKETCRDIVFNKENRSGLRGHGQHPREHIGTEIERIYKELRDGVRVKG